MVAPVDDDAPAAGGADKPAVRMTRIEDLDRPIYRIFPLWFFEQALRTRSIALVQPSKWPDPYEDVCSNIMMRDGRNPAAGQRQLHDFLMPAYAQCWSFESNSDILLRAYSRVALHPFLLRNMEPANEGVRVETTPRKLIHAVNTHALTQRGVQFYLGGVLYLPGDEVSQRIVNALGAIGATEMGRGDHRADMLFLKRDYFRHEDEVRLLAIFADRAAAYDPYTVQVDPNQLFTKVSFDSRLITFERREREEKARQLGYQGPFSGEEEGIRILWDVVLPDGWGD